MSERIALHLGYSDIIWLYAHRRCLKKTIPIPRFPPKIDTFCVADQLLQCLYQQTMCALHLETLMLGLTILRTTTLYGIVTSLFLIQGRRHLEAVKAYHFMRGTLLVDNPLFYLVDIKKHLSKEYNTFITHL